MLTFGDLFRNRDLLFRTGTLPRYKPALTNTAVNPRWLPSLFNGLYRRHPQSGTLPRARLDHHPDLKFMNAADRYTVSHVKPVFREARLPSVSTLRAASSDPSVQYAPPTSNGNE